MFWCLAVNGVGISEHSIIFVGMCWFVQIPRNILNFETAVIHPGRGRKASRGGILLS